MMTIRHIIELDEKTRGTKVSRCAIIPSNYLNIIIMLIIDDILSMKYDGRGSERRRRIDSAAHADDGQA